MYNSQDIASRIKATAKIRGITMKMMLADLDLGINIISHLAKGQEMSYLNLAKIADYLNCSVDYLLGRTSDPKTTYENIQSSNIVNVNGNNGDHSPLTVNKASDEDKELLELIQGLSLKQKAKVITYIYETIEAEK